MTPVWAWSFFPFLLPEDLAHPVFDDLNGRCGGEGGWWTVLIVVWRDVHSGQWGVFLNLQ